MAQKISDILSKDVVTIGQEDCLEDAIALLDSQSQSHLIVLKNGRISGIISKTDILDRLKTLMAGSGGNTYNKIILHSLKVKDFMTPDPVCVNEGDDINKAIEILINENHRFIPVLDSEKHVSGVITAIDLLKYLYYKMGKSY